MLAIHIAASFMSIYLYQQGYSVLFIGGFWALFFLFKAIVALPLAALAGWFGPKHAILLSNVLYIPSMAFFSLLPEYGPTMLIPVLVFQGLSSALYSIAYNIDFSKVKSIEHAGKEIAYMNIVEKVTAGISPLIGGFLAFFLGPQVVLAVAGMLFAMAALPLLRTAEPVPPRQKLAFKGFPWHLLRPVIAAQTAVGFDVFTSGTAWSLYIAIFIIGIGTTNEVYMINGILMSVVLLAALASSYVYGRLIDRKQGKQLMYIAVIANSLTHIVRPLTNTPTVVAGLNVLNEAATTGYTMSYHRAMFDNADLSGRRTTYIGMSEAIANFGAGLGALTLALLVSLVGEQEGLEGFFLVTAGVVLLVLTARFPLFRK